MKTEIKIIVETPNFDKLTVLPEAGDSEEDYTKEELEETRKEYAKDLHKNVIKDIENYFSERFDEEFMERLEEQYVEGWDDIQDYGIEISVEVKE